MLVMRTVTVEVKTKKKEPLPDIIEQLEASLKAALEGKIRKA